MTAQPETLKFGPQWIRKLSDCAFSSHRSSRTSGDNLPSGCLKISNEVPEDMKMVVTEKTDKILDCVEGTETKWDAICSRPLGEETSGLDVVRRSQKMTGVCPNSNQTGRSAYCDYSCPPSERDIVGKTTLDPPLWPKSADQAVTDQNWRRHSQVSNPASDIPQWNQARSSVPTTCDNSLSHIPGLGQQTNSLWDQQKQLWSKSTPQQLHGLDSLDPISNSLLEHNISCSVPEMEKTVSHTEQTAFFESTSSTGQLNSPASRPTTYSSLEEERGLLCPDGADDPDEHMWLYEDPQGRTQGTFSDAQMNDWLLAGIYFTPSLRIRRKCDSSFSTLADYTRLFGRIPFVPGPRVTPIRGGISTPVLNTLPKSGTLDPPAPSDHLDNVNTSGLPHSIGLSSSSNSTATVSGPYGRMPSISSQQTNHEFASNLMSVVPPNQSESRMSSSIPGTTSMCVNSSLPVLQARPQLNALSNALSGLNTSSELDTHLAGNLGYSTNGASAFMALASLLSMNPTLASLALSFSGQASGGHNTDLAAAALTPGFLTALAQYLNVQPHSSNHQPTSPMQQLAETAQLAAQLAALAGAHSPDQTPMQPDQALALAQLVISQASNAQWVAHTKKDGGADSDRVPESDAVDRRLSKGNNDESTARASSSANAAGDDIHQDQPSHWPPLSSASTATRTSPRFGDGRSNTKSNDTVQHGEHRDGQSRVPVGFSNRQHHSKVQPVGSRSSAGRSKHINGILFDLSQGPEAMGQSVWRGNGEVLEDSHGNDGHLEQTRGTPPHQQSSRTPPMMGQWAHKVKQTPIKSVTQVTRASTENSRTATCVANTSPKSVNKSTGGNASHNSRATTNQNATNTNTGRSPEKSSSYRSDTKGNKSTNSEPVRSCALSSSDSDRTAQEELERLTSWCQTRLSSIPLREKVDIPTVVELLATLDAPYEVERMVQTFMGESTRTSLFVKDFLDRRRPFWQLHRERRDNENVTPSVRNTNGNTSKSGDKKKRSGGQENSNHNTHKPSSGTSVLNGTPGWTKVGHAHADKTDHSQDNQWHHIKPKGSHNRKSKKDKVS